MNFIFLLTYREPGKEERLERTKKVKSGELHQETLWKSALHELRKPIVIGYMVVFSGFWFMFNALFDVLPIHIDEWVDTSVIVRDLFGDQGVQIGFVKAMFTMSKDGLRILPEGMININSFLIMTSCFLVAAISGKFRVTTAMFIGAILSCLTMVFIGATASAWIIAVGIAIFSFGEMLISPKKNEFMGNIAPKDKKAMYLGFVMLPQGVGWTLEGYFGPKLYEMFASKNIFARQMLAEKGMSPAEIDQIPQGEGFMTLVSYTGESAQSLTQLLYTQNNVGLVWYIIGAIGTFSAVGILLYGRWIYRMQTAIR